MPRCPNCRRPVENDDEVCDFCGELVLGQDAGEGRSSPEQDTEGKSRTGQSQNSPRNEQSASTESSSQRHSPGTPREARGEEQSPPRQEQSDRTPPPQTAQGEGRSPPQPQDRQASPPRDARGQGQPPQQNSPQQPQNTRRAPDAQSSGSSSGTSRRGFLLGGIGTVALLGGGGWFFFLRGNKRGPDEVAEDFVNEIDNWNVNNATKMIHPNSPLSGAEQAANLLISSTPTSQAVSIAIKKLNIKVNDTVIQEQTDGRSTVSVAVQINSPLPLGSFDKIQADIPLDMRTNDGKWYVWNLDVNI